MGTMLIFRKLHIVRCVKSGFFKSGGESNRIITSITQISKIMATITNASLSLAHDHKRRVVEAVVKCNINFSSVELCQMKTCPGRYFKAKCELWKDDPWYAGGDASLYTFNRVYYFPDPTPSATESISFKETLGEGLLDEDVFGEDEIFGLIRLTNLSTLFEIKRKTNTVSHHF